MFVPTKRSYAKMKTETGNLLLFYKKSYKIILGILAKRSDLRKDFFLGGLQKVKIKRDLRYEIFIKISNNYFVLFFNFSNIKQTQGWFNFCCAAAKI